MRDSLYTNTELYGLIGQPVKHSLSPFIHNVAAELTGYHMIYLPFDVHSSNLKTAVKGMLALGMKGFNITIPHKVKVMNLLDKVSEEARVVGAVNTVVNEIDKLTGYNTDVYGIIESLSQYKSDINGEEVVVFGSGGSARAVLYSLIKHFKPSKINIVNRTEQHAEELKTYFAEKTKFDAISTYDLFPHELKDVLNKSKLLINTTPLGTTPDVDDAVVNIEDVFNKNQIVFDLVYNPVKTKFLRLAESKGAQTIDGLKMLVQQAAGSFYLWTNIEMPVDKVYKSLQLYLSK